MSEFLHGIRTFESTTGPLAIVDVSSSVVAIFGTSEKATPQTLNHVTNYDDAYALFGEGSITKALRRVYTYVPSNSVIGIPLGKDSDFPEPPPEPETSGVSLGSSSAIMYLDAADNVDIPDEVPAGTHSFAPATWLDGKAGFYNSGAENHEGELTPETLTYEPTGDESYIGKLIADVSISNPNLTMTFSPYQSTPFAVLYYLGKQYVVEHQSDSFYFLRDADKVTELYNDMLANVGDAKNITIAWCEVVSGEAERYTPIIVNNPKGATIAYSSSNEAVATVDPVTGVVTPLTVGETEITLTVDYDDGTDAGALSMALAEYQNATTKKATTAALKAVDDAKAAATETLAYTLTVADTNPDLGKERNGASFSSSVGEVSIGTSLAPVSLNNPNGLAVNYTSSDDTIAIVNADGVVTGLKEGSATITAEMIGDATYGSSMLTYEVTASAESDALLAAFIEALPLLRKVKNKYGFSAKIHLAPNILHKSGAAALGVSAVKQTRGIWVGDMPEDVSTTEEAYAFRQEYGSDRYMVAWPRPLVIQADGSTQVDWFAPSLAGLIAQVDRNATGDTIVSQTGYWCSPSNYPLVDVVGPSIDVDYIPSDTACDVNYLNANGIYTVINRGGWHGFGNYSTAYPESTQITSFLCVRRTADIIEESIEDATLQFLDKPMFTSPTGLANTVMGRVRDTVNDYLRSKEGTALVYSNVYLLAEDNPLINLQQGKIKYRYQFTPPIPMQTVEYEAEIYVEALETAFTSLIGGNS